jgi:hypothetical protein
VSGNRDHANRAKKDKKSSSNSKNAAAPLDAEPRVGGNSPQHDTAAPAGPLPAPGGNISSPFTVLAGGDLASRSISERIPDGATTSSRTLHEEPIPDRVDDEDETPAIREAVHATPNVGCGNSVALARVVGGKILLWDMKQVAQFSDVCSGSLIIYQW